MSRSALRRVVEAFFHRWPFYVLLVVLALGAGFLQIRRGVDEYVSVGSILTKGGSLVTAQSGLQNEPYYGFLSASQYTSQELVGLIFTESFMEAVAVDAGVELPGDPTGRAFTLQALRAGLNAWPTSGSIVVVTATTDDPQLSADVATSVMDQYLVFKEVVDREESGASEEFFGELSEPYRRELAAAQAELNRALEAVDPEEGATPAEQLVIERLTAAERLAFERYQETVREVEQARLAELQIETDIEQRFSILDVPEPAEQPLGRRLDDILVLVMFGTVGLLLMVAGPVFAALSNDVLVFADDLDPELGIGVVAELPRFRPRELDPSRAVGPPDVPAEPTDGPEPDEPVLIGAMPGGDTGGPGPSS